MGECLLYHNFARDFGAALIIPIHAIKKDASLRENYLTLVEHIDDLKKESDRTRASITFFMIEMVFDMILASKHYCENHDFLLSLIKDTKKHEVFF